MIVGSALLVAGFAGDALVLYEWMAHGFGHLYAVRTVFFSTLAFCLGVEVIFSSVFLSMLGISRDTYIGE
ncbi:MAG: hypothetical protein JO356_18905 [Acidobacteria bacterium]|nr:hypothetical protein [Acidobacteriota bacterium]